MPNYLCRPTELNSSSPVLPEEAHCLELSEDSENLRGRGGRGEERDRWNGGKAGNRERERERVREKERGGKSSTGVNYMDIHVHSRII